MKILGNTSKKILEKILWVWDEDLLFLFCFSTKIRERYTFDFEKKTFFFAFNQNSGKNTFNLGLQSVWYGDSQFSSCARGHCSWETLEGGHIPSKVGNHCCRLLILLGLFVCLFVWNLTRVELTTETAWINLSFRYKQCCEYLLNIWIESANDE